MNANVFLNAQVFPNAHAFPNAQPPQYVSAMIQPRGWQHGAGHGHNMGCPRAQRGGKKSTVHLKIF
jgi:hypothetical protein